MCSWCRFAPLQLSAYAELRDMLAGMENDLGLNNLNRVERDMYHACYDTIATDGSFTSGELRAHRLMADVPPATFHRALKKLIEAGWVMRHEDCVKKNYTLVVQE
jgi:hypothetical protein